ncbi:Rne/Rng family ribonuclease [Ruegeria atlantica]|uniref:Rne/Rng family ribonuclease n=1 Tax=Ruegeria atlantica TaxID=81569 RepID=UPI0024947B56|nr:Rne/Rng family ribonuclease [Ruegeria atlantica]
MAKKMLIDATHAEETRVVVVDGNKVEEFDFESENKRQLAGNIYLAKVTRVEPSLQAAFVDYGGNRHGFLAFSEIHPDYYQIPVADREALMEEERAYAEAMKARDEAEETKPKKRRSRSRTKAADVKSDDAVESIEVSNEPTGMETIDLDESEDGADGPELEGTSPADRVAETPVEEPFDDAGAPEADAEGAAEGTLSEDGSEAANSSDAPAIEATEAKDEETADKSDDAVNETEAQDAPEASGDATEENEGKSEEETRPDATAKDDSIESVADEDDSEDIRPVRKPRPRRYKIQEVIKVRQVLLVQVVKEERGNKGAALTTYLSLAGRYCVLMPNTARGGGISRKITNAPDRKKLKEIAAEIDVPTGAGLIIRTAGAKRTKSEIKRDYEYLQRMWEQIRELTLKSIAPAKIYEEGDLIKRSIRDLYNREIDEVLVEGEGGYRIAKDFMKMIMPSHAKNVKRYEDALPLFARYQVESYLAGMFNPTVQLKSGGYIVIGVTEALVAIDVNSGRATKEGSIEETALKTNLEAAEEVARQLRLRDLAGLIVIDFIDMDERKNNLAVEKRMKERLKTDRARIQVGRISGFGLMEMSRQRLRPGMLEATTQPCPACHGTGLIRSDDNMALSILRQIEEEGTRRRSREVLVRCPVSIANFLMNQKREHIAQIEARYGLSVRVEGDVHLVSPDFSMEKFKTASRIVPEASAPVVSVDASLMDLVDASEEEPVEEETTVQAEEDAKPKRKRRRRRRKKSNGSDEAPEVNAEEGDAAAAEESDEAKTEAADDAKPEGEASEPAEEEKAAKPKRRRAPRRKKKDAEPVEVTEEVAAEAVVSKDAQAASPEAPAEETGVTDAPVEAPVETAEKVEQAESVAELPTPEAESVVEEKVEPAEAEQPEPVAEVAAEDPQEPADVMVEEAAEPVLEVVAEEPEQPAKPKRRGWWSLGQ